jgi:hypothetical protein
VTPAPPPRRWPPRFRRSAPNHQEITHQPPLTRRQRALTARACATSCSNIFTWTSSWRRHQVDHAPGTPPQVRAEPIRPVGLCETRRDFVSGDVVGRVRPSWEPGRWGMAVTRLVPALPTSRQILVMRRSRVRLPQAALVDQTVRLTNLGSAPPASWRSFERAAWRTRPRCRPPRRGPRPRLVAVVTADFVSLSRPN